MNSTEILNGGYATKIETWGSDERIVEAARMSTAKGFLGWGGVDPCPMCAAQGLFASDGLYSDAAARALAVKNCTTCGGQGTKPGDEKLLRFLWENKHATPFEMAGMTVEIKAPIFVFREWHRHRTQSYNEMSARYVPLPDENYIPSMGRLLAGGQSATNKQASGAAVPEADALEWLAELAEVYEHAQRVYESGIRRGIAKELARLPVPVARFSRMRASANLRNWLGFLTLRMNPAAQWEIRQYANAVGAMISEAFPRTWGLFSEGRT